MLATYDCNAALSGLQSVNKFSIKTIALSAFSLKPERLTSPNVQRSLVSIFPEISQEKKYSIIWKLAAVERVDAEVVAQLLDELDKQLISAGSVNLIFRMVRPEYLADKRIMSTLTHLASSQNIYIRNLTLRLLKK